MTQQILAINDLYFAYPDGQEALRGVSISLDVGEKVALVGPNGSGKSTLMLCLSGLLDGPGQVSVDNLALNKNTLPDIRARIGLVFQNPDDQLFSPTVFEDVAFGPLHTGLPEAEVQQQVSQALATVGMSNYADRLSYHLSTGEKKRVAIATVLSMHTSLLVLDEPTAGLDPRGRRQLISLLEELPHSMLVATHDLLMVRELFPRMIVLDEGRVVADGETETIMGDTVFLEKHGLAYP